MNQHAFLSLFLLLLSNHLLNAQINFEAGYFIDNNGQRQECLIQNKEWKNNPTEIRYKQDETGSTQIAKISNLREFGIDGVSRYQRFIGDVDLSSLDVNNLGYERKPVFVTDTILLQVLIDGQASLYHYANSNTHYFFYQIGEGEIAQLIYKKYHINSHRVGVNNTYKTQLFQDLSHPGFTANKLKTLDYDLREISKLFIAYNEVKNSTFISYNTQLLRPIFHLTPKVGVSFSSLAINNDTAPWENTDFGSYTNYRIGLEAEFIMPFGRNKWSFTLEPTYQQFHAESEALLGTTIVDYQSIAIPLGVRYYSFLTDRSKLFLNAAVLVELPFPNSELDIRKARVLKIYNYFNYNFGLGFQFGNRISTEVSYRHNSKILRAHRFWHANFPAVSLIFGYSIF